MSKRRYAIVIEFEDNLALIDWHEHGRPSALLGAIQGDLDDLGIRARVEPDLLWFNAQDRDDRPGRWISDRTSQPARPSEIAIAAVMAARNAAEGKTHWDKAREWSQKELEHQAEERRKNIEYAEMLQAAEDEEE